MGTHAKHNIQIIDRFITLLEVSGGRLDLLFCLVDQQQDAAVVVIVPPGFYFF